jgi:NAD(P)-dependent dehydrogenase (short-subunit alcohol dehydrogenase family)
MADPRLAGRVVAVMGAAGGLGPTLVQRLVDEGAHVAAVGRGADALDELARSPWADGRVHAQAADLADLGAARVLADAIAGGQGRVDGVVHIVGGWRGNGPIAEIADDDWAALEGPLLHTVLNVTRAFAEPLKASGQGRFVIVSAHQAQRPTAGNAIYAATKAAAEAWTLALADELRESGSGATANIVVVKAIVTAQMRAAKPDARFRIHTPAEDVAAAIAFVLSDAGAQMNGQRLSLHP